MHLDPPAKIFGKRKMPTLSLCGLLRSVVGSCIQTQAKLRGGLSVTAAFATGGHSGSLLRVRVASLSFAWIGKEGRHPVIQRELHSEQRILPEHSLPHLAGALGCRDVRVPIGNVLLHESDR